jgi:predicted aspartyl protease
LIENPITGKSVRVRALVDTGTTFTIVPRKVLKNFNSLSLVGRLLRLLKVL